MAVKLQAPIEVELKIKITDESGHKDGTVTIGMGIGCYPTEQDLRDRVERFAKEEMPAGFRLMNKREWFDTVFGKCREEDEDGNPEYISYAIPGGNEWDA